MMDLLVELCLQNHLNPSHHVLEIWSSETQQPLSFKPNTLIGSLNVHTVLLKEKVPEERVKPGLTKAPEVSGARGLSENIQRCKYICIYK
jgi:protein cordon-bleu